MPKGLPPSHIASSPALWKHAGRVARDLHKRKQRMGFLSSSGSKPSSVKKPRKRKVGG